VYNTPLLDVESLNTPKLNILNAYSKIGNRDIVNRPPSATNGE